MSRDGNGVYSKPAGTTAVSGTTIESSKFNTLIDDIVADLNLDRPIAAGGTGASTAAGARTGLGLGTIATQDSDNVTVTGGTLDDVTIGGTTPGAGTFTSLDAGNLVGMVASFAMDTPPAGWLKANGAAVSRTTYAALFTAIGTTYGVGDGSTTFNLPDLRGEFVRGWDDGRGIDSGRAFGSAQLDQMQRITGNLSGTPVRGNASTTSGAGAFSASVDNGQGSAGAAGTYGRSIDFDSANSPDARVSSGTDGETRPRNIALMYCIKY